MTTAEVQQLVADTANAYGVPAPVALAVAQHESGFNPAAVNRGNANGTADWGVMQLNDTTVATMGVSNPLDPVENVDAGVRLLAQLLGRYAGDVRSAIWAYASGPGNVGPDKAPNAIAASFINYVLGYPGVMPAAGDSAAAGDAGAPPAANESGKVVLIALGALAGLLVLAALIRGGD